MEYLKNKDCAQLLVELYKNCFNWSGNKEIHKPTTEVTEEQRKKYCDSAQVTDEEILAYDNKLIYISDENFLNRLDVVRERTISKKNFVYMFFYPTYHFFLHQSSECIGVHDLEIFAAQNGLFEGVIKGDVKDWMAFEAETIRKKDAEKIVENIKNFLEPRIHHK